MPIGKLFKSIFRRGGSGGTKGTTTNEEGSKAVDRDTQVSPPASGPPIEPAAAKSTTPERVAADKPSTPAVPAAITGLSYALLRASLAGLSKDAAGVFQSPLSVYYALALALNGAGPGTSTHTQLLGLLTAGSESLTEATLNAEISKHIDALGGGEATDGGVLMLIANGIFTKSPVNSEFSASVGKLFGASSQQVADEKPINEWVNSATKGEIAELVPPGTDFDTALVNALYFKGLWVTPFDADNTKPKVFHTPSGDRTVSMMRHKFDGRSRARVISAPGLYDAVLLPYKSGGAAPSEFAAMCVLPAEGVSVDKVAAALAELAVGHADTHKAESTSPDVTIVELPKFRSESSDELRPVLQSLGITDAFDAGADFSRVSPGLFISSVLHKAVVEVDEAGTVAAAATAVMMTRGMPMAEQPPVKLIFDRPFIFSIMHMSSNTPVFMGVVQAPPEHKAPQGAIADAGHSSDALAVVLAVVQAQTQQIASLVDLVHLLVSRVPGAPMQMPHAVPHAVPHAAHSAPRAAPAAKAAQPARPAAAAAPVASAAGAPAAERPAAAGAARAASARAPSRRGGLPARVGEMSLCSSHVLSIPVAAATRLIASRGSEGQMARDGIVRGALRDASYLGSTRHVRRLFSDCYGSEETAVAAAAVRVAAAAADGVSLPVCLAMNLVRFVHDVSGRDRPAGGGVVSASFLNAKPAVGGIGVEPRRGGVLRVLFTVASDAVADTVVRSRRNLRDVDPSAAVFDVLSDREEAQHRALWPAFLAAKAAGKRAQFHRARLVVDGERVPAPAC
ncbi:hypothetical protein FOA52_004242 [Chlamydomonas sp. UWO 241]|nr:hypothetical protein FOA52_004242 [Chlamydomonas sp. UWO 241]